MFCIIHMKNAVYEVFPMSMGQNCNANVNSN